MAYVLGSSSYIYYHGCESDCDTSEPTWRGMIFEDANLLSETDPVIPLDPRCSFGVWALE
jgi:hypothetical protein